MGAARGRASADGPVRVFLLDDNEAYLAGLTDLVDAEADLDVVGRATSPMDAVDGMARCQPDVAVLDIRLNGPDPQPGATTGVDVCRQVRSDHPRVACLMLTAFPNDGLLHEAADAGAAGLVLKKIRGGELLEAIRRIAAGADLLAAPVTLPEPGHRAP